VIVTTPTPASTNGTGAPTATNRATETRPIQSGRPPRTAVPESRALRRALRGPLLYVCDRANDRSQVFKPDGTFVKEMFYNKRTLGSGSVWDIAFSKDAQQKYIFMARRRKRSRDTSSIVSR
jgi:hypothetical protein